MMCHFTAKLGHRDEDDHQEDETDDSEENVGIEIEWKTTQIVQPDWENCLRSAMILLENFFRISGLRISISKTKAVWFGSARHHTHKYVPIFHYNGTQNLDF